MDTCLFFSVIKKEKGLWQVPLQVLLAAARGDVRLTASALLLAELSSFKGDVARSEQDRIIEQYLVQGDIEWVELDLFTAQEARRLCVEYRLRGADAVHLASAVRRGADYFMSNDKRFPYGQSIQNTKVRHPEVVWPNTLEDAQVELEAGLELDVSIEGGEPDLR
ncbi:type II toxin-antitoxin system VapC family toxin [Actinotalea solisilvae]|uniref:type II toxin-antitoxin system VapC family toxin n=1 Tax=Actinotalea solisilvae TaxID=2072922 RepID=UPI0018F1965C|nr:PIN domain-containing protein [Actinotalea solisilvae]